MNVGHADRALILNWLYEGQQLGASHMILVHDDFDNEDYPEFVYAVRGEDVRAKHKEIDDNPTLIVLGVYDLTKDFEKQVDLPTPPMNF